MWQYTGQGAWHFISLPEDIAKEIRDFLKSEEAGWGRLNATAKIGQIEWKTAIWFDTKKNTYLLPVKADIRRKEKIQAGDTVDVTVWL